MGLDISAYSHLRFVRERGDDEDYDDDLVLIYQVDGDRVDDAPYGLYARTDDVHVWWHAEHGTFAIPDSEIERIEQHIAGLRDGSTKPGTPGDLAVLDENRATTEYHGFRAGSYSGYNWWRKHLSQLALDEEPEDVWDDELEGPFCELINFPDNEGAIGSVTCAKLHADFVEHETRVVEAARAKIAEKSDLEYFIEIYGEFKRAFELGAQRGFVKFH